MKAIALITLLTCLSGCNELVAVDVDIYQLCYSEVDVEVPAAESGGVQYAVLEQDAIDLDLPDDVAARASLRYVVVSPSAVLDDFAFVEEFELSVRVRDPESPLPALPLVSYSRPVQNSTTPYEHPPIPELRLPGNSDIDVVQYLQAGGLNYELFFGPAPKFEWKLDVQACFDVTLDWGHSR